MKNGVGLAKLKRKFLVGDSIRNVGRPNLTILSAGLVSPFSLKLANFLVENQFLTRLTAIKAKNI